MSNTAVVFSCAHSTPEFGNERFDWLGRFLFDIKPDYVVDLGDFGDMKSLNSYDSRYPQAIVSQSYQADIESYNDAQDRLRHQFRSSKKRMPTWYGFEGNHEHRLKKALAIDPRLEGEKYGISFKHLDTDYWYDEYIEYENGGPGIYSIDGVGYAHFFSSGNLGQAMSGEHHAYNLLRKRHSSSTCGHSHKRSIFFKDDAYPKRSIGLVAGCYKGGADTWAGQASLGWWKGVVVKRQIEDGSYEPEFVSMERLKKAYG